MKSLFPILLISMIIPTLLSAEISVETQNLPIPPIIEGNKIELDIQKGVLELPFGTSETLGFNGNYLGPTIRISNGDNANLILNNNIDENTTVHWHGLHVPAQFDGGPHQIIQSGESWNPQFTIKQAAATLWYHPHLMGKTAEHVYRGLAGMFIIDDEYSKALNIPQDYGVNDIPLILQDRRVGRDGSFEYRPSRPDIMHGYTGDVVLVNGAYNPVLELNKGTYRFRILNGSNSSIYRVSFSEARRFTVIASDGGFLPESVETDQLIMSPGERYEILVDFDSIGESGILLDIYGGTSYLAMSISTSSIPGRFFQHPKYFEYDHPDYSSTELIRRTFNMETRGMGRFTINGKQMDMDVINFKLPRNSEEIWTVKNIGRGMMNIPHSFHVHDTQFTILSFNGRSPAPLYRGPKDTILLMPGDEAVLGVSFSDYSGIYMYHCHLLEHEDSGMMGQFLIE
ncbi:MAG: multicopper oxidase domain-containing protein [Spirochaetales bacterium]|nr:multicopper oxidase domain-containing protein [Spirochaetales bacterium]